MAKGKRKGSTRKSKAAAQERIVRTSDNPAKIVRVSKQRQDRGSGGKTQAAAKRATNQDKKRRSSGQKAATQQTSPLAKWTRSNVSKKKK